MPAAAAAAAPRECLFCVVGGELHTYLRGPAAGGLCETPFVCSCSAVNRIFFYLFIFFEFLDGVRFECYWCWGCTV